MAPEETNRVVRAVVVYDGGLLLVADGPAWALPCGTPEPAESAQATAARVVYELTGYLVDGTEALEPRGAEEADGAAAVVCQLLSGSPSDGARLSPDRVRWAPMTGPETALLPPAVRHYLQGHTPV